MDLTFVDRALGSGIPYVTYAVPVFFILIGIELVAALWQHRQAYRLHDSLNDLSCGITEQMVGLFLKGLLFVVCGDKTELLVELRSVVPFSADDPENDLAQIPVHRKEI